MLLLLKTGLTPPSLPPAPKPSSIKPPAHWLTQQTETKPAEREDVDPNAKGGIYEDLKQFFSSNSSSSLVSVFLLISLRHVLIFAAFNVWK